MYCLIKCNLVSSLHSASLMTEGFLWGEASAQMGPRVPTRSLSSRDYKAFAFLPLKLPGAHCLLTSAETLFLSLCLHLPTTCRAWETFSEDAKVSIKEMLRGRSVPVNLILVN